ncbi:hypothetical protein TNCV_425281 [Trichonephila clavipes]|nr:hypothetical protein TNCV_425281 [Trichonephila clavipes]
MYDPSSFADPTPLAHADTSRDVLPRGGTSQLVDENMVKKARASFFKHQSREQNEAPTEGEALGPGPVDSYLKTSLGRAVVMVTSSWSTCH